MAINLSEEEAERANFLDDDLDLDLQKIAEKVYELLLFEIEIENERLGQF